MVQPVQSPYWTQRLSVLAQEKDLELTLLLERDSFAHRPGWQLEPIEGVTIHVIGSKVVSSVRKGEDLGYRIQGVRSIPWSLTLELWRRKPDVVVLCNATQLIFALPLKYFSRTRLALIVEDTPHATRNLGWLAMQVKRWLYKRANKCFALSADAEKFLNSIGVKDEVERSSWSLDMDFFRPPPGKTKPSSVQKAGRKVVFIGALVNNKGVRHLLGAWKALCPEVRRGSELLLVGSGPLLQEVQAFIQKQGLHDARIMGQLTYIEVRNLLQQADACAANTAGSFQFDRAGGHGLWVCSDHESI